METWPIDKAFVEFQAFKSKIDPQSQNMNEAATRLRIIDNILFDVLGWDKAEVEPEKYCRAAGYADYVVFLEGKPCLTLEAKKEDLDFFLPDSKYGDTPYTFALLGKDCPEARAALQQALGYAATLGCRYIAISNGHQWLFAFTFVEEQPIDERLVFVFESIEAISSKFRLFWNCFSKEGIGDNLMADQLLQSRRRPAPAKLSASIPGYPASASRNIFQNELSYILEIVWQVMSQNETTLDFLKDCYVSPIDHEEIISTAKELIDRRRQKDTRLAETDISKAVDLPTKFADISAEKPFVILGEVGRGKTSFLKYLRLVAAEIQFKNYIQIDVDFVDRPDDATQVANYIYNEIDRQLKDMYSIDIFEDHFARGVLFTELQRWRKTPKGIFYAGDKDKYAQLEIEHIEELMKDQHSYLVRVFNYLKKGQNKSVALFFDNLDRRPSSIQEEAFLKSSAIARDWGCLVFVCLRPSTFYYSKQNGVLDSIAPKAFTVGQPDLSIVLKRRFSYAKKLASGTKGLSSWANIAPSRDVALDLPSVAKLLDRCEFAAQKRHGIIPMLEAVSNGNIRVLLDHTMSILTAGHLDTKKILGYIETSKVYVIPDFEGVKTLLYGDYMHYDPSKSVFINLFDLFHSDKREHFLRYAALSYLNRFSLGDPAREYVRRSELKNYLSTLGFCSDDISRTVEYLFERKCIRGKIDGVSLSDAMDDIRITHLGRYHVNNLVYVFQYIDALVVDTPVLDADLRAKLTYNTDISSRLTRTSAFINYLDQCSNSINDPILKQEWNLVKQNVNQNIEEISERIAKDRNDTRENNKIK